MNTSYIISLAITGTLSLSLGIFVYLRNRQSSVNKVWYPPKSKHFVMELGNVRERCIYRKNNCTLFCSTMLCGFHLHTCFLLSFREFFNRIKTKSANTIILCISIHLFSLQFHLLYLSKT